MLTPKKQRALQALLTNATKQEAAKAAGISPRTLCDYLADEEFQREYKRAFRQLVTDATRQAQQSLSPSLHALSDIVQDEGENSNTRISAARTLLEYTLRLTEISDILQELEGDADVL